MISRARRKGVRPDAPLSFVDDLSAALTHVAHGITNFVNEQARQEAQEQLAEAQALHGIVQDIGRAIGINDADADAQAAHDAAETAQIDEAFAHNAADANAADANAADANAADANAADDNAADANAADFNAAEDNMADANAADANAADANAADAGAAGGLRPGDVQRRRIVALGAVLEEASRMPHLSLEQLVKVRRAAIRAVRARRRD
jgi:hypothetical protein